MADGYLQLPEEKGPVPPVRAAVATLIIVGLLVVSTLYHDGVVGIDRIRDVSEHAGLYRLKGTVQSVNETGFVLSDGTGTVDVRWRLTDLAVGSSVVVNGEYNATSKVLRGQAVGPTYVFR